MGDSQLESIIDKAWEDRESITSATSGEIRDAVEAALESMDSGKERVASPLGDHKWRVNQWLKKAVLLSFRLNDMEMISGGPGDNQRGASAWWDKVPSKFSGWSDEQFKSSGLRAVPNCVVRRSAYIAPGVVLMPSFVNLGAYVDSGTSEYNSSRISYGSSWSAPMISGGVALMAQAFPNHTSEHLVDRILASANNVWFTPEGNTTFTTHGNSVKHGYHSTWGHGVPDFYAALSPITSDGNPASMSLYTSNSIQSREANSLGSSNITPSSSFGDAVSHGLIGEVGYAYDDLNGGFNFDMSTRVGTSNNHEISINLSEELSRLDTPMNDHDDYSSERKFIGNASTLFYSNKLETSLTLGNSPLPVQSFFGKGSEPTLDLSDFETPYLASNSDGLGLNATYKLDNSQLLIGASNPIRSPYDAVSYTHLTLPTILLV